MNFVIVPLLASAALALASGTSILIWKPNRAVNRAGRGQMEWDRDSRFGNGR